MTDLSKRHKGKEQEEWRGSRKKVEIWFGLTSVTREKFLLVLEAFKPRAMVAILHRKQDI